MALPLLEAKSLTAHYGSVQVLDDVSVDVAGGDLLLLAGPNGAGKSTLLRTLIGLHRPTSGSIWFEGRNITKQTPSQRARAGIAWIPEGRGVIGELSVEDNLDTARFCPRWSQKNRELSFERFPILQRCLKRPARTLSGGEQQMLALARAIETAPTLLLIDEPSLGLAPKIVIQVMDYLIDLRNQGQTILLVEQRAAQVQHVASHIRLMGQGRISQVDEGSVEFTEVDFKHFVGGHEPGGTSL